MAEGFKGTIDWVGYPVGQPGAAPPTAGFKGLLDFTGYSVGLPAAAAGTPPLRTMLGVGT